LLLLFFLFFFLPPPLFFLFDPLPLFFLVIFSYILGALVSSKITMQHVDMFGTTRLATKTQQSLGASQVSFLVFFSIFLIFFPCFCPFFAIFSFYYVSILVFFPC